SRHSVVFWKSLILPKCEKIFSETMETPDSVVPGRIIGSSSVFPEGWAAFLFKSIELLIFCVRIAFSLIGFSWKSRVMSDAEGPVQEPCVPVSVSMMERTLWRDLEQYPSTGHFPIEQYAKGVRISITVSEKRVHMFRRCLTSGPIRKFDEATLVVSFMVYILFT
ncbi:unnamed protein product, partial [Allacma fusca]